MGRKNQSENKYFKNRRNKKLWHRLLLAAGSIVVFITTYMLILPAITAEVGTIELFDESLSSGSAVTPEDNETYIIIEETTEETVEETTEEPTEDITSEETTDGAAEALSEETSDQALEETTSGSSSGGTDTSGGGGTASEASSEISEEETEETTESEFVVSAENMLIALLGEAGIDLADETNAIAETSITFSGSGTDGAYVCTYDPDTGNFKLELKADLVIDVDDVVSITEDADAVAAAKAVLSNSTTTSTQVGSYNNIYTFSLPEGIVLTDDLLYDSDKNTRVYLGADGTTDYVYYFEKKTAEDGSTYYDVVIVFLNDYIDKQSGTIEGTLTIEAYIDSSYYDSETKTITVGDGSLSEEIIITAENITWDENETLYSDLIMYKTASYNSSEKTITYTIRVLTTKGTGGEVTISDVVTSSSALTGLSSNGLSSITYSTGNMWAYKDSSLSTVEDSLTYMGDIVPISQASAGDAYYYYDSDGNMIIVLPELVAPDTTSDYYTSTCYNWYSSYYTYYNEYYITYTYDVSPDSTTTYNINNTATGTSTDETTGADLKDSSEAEVKISSTKLISKSGSLSGDTITWTITVGDGSTDLSGYVLTDTMFGEIKNFTITGSNGSSVVYGEDYETMSDNGYIASITFLKGTYYTITYTQTVEAGWSDTTYSNTSTLTGGKYSESSTAGVKVEGYSDKCLIKKSSGMSDDDGDGIYILSWTAGVYVPEEGIPAGTTFTDYIEGTDHYITYEQAKAIATAIQDAFGEENVIDIYFSTQSGGNMWYIDSSKWVSLEDLKNNESTYADTKFYLYKFTTVYDIAYDTSAAAVAAYSAGEEITSGTAIVATSVDLAEEAEETAANSLGLDPVMQAVIAQALDLSAEETEEEAEEVITYGFTANEPLALAADNTITTETTSDGTVYYYSTNEITFDYYTTADVSSVTTDRTYYNYIFNEGNYAADSTTYSKNVVKYGVNQYGYLQTGDLTISTSTTENEISWVVKVNLSDAYTEYIITDAIPSGAAIETVYVSQYENYSYEEIDSTSGTAYCGMNFTYTVADNENTDGSKDVVVTIANADEATIDAVYIKFTCKVTVEPDGEETKKSVSYANSVKVTADGKDYGDADETITVSYTESSTGTNYDVSKSHSYDTTNNLIHYVIGINEKGETYTYKLYDDNNNEVGEEAYSDLTITDTLTYSTYPSYGTARDVSLSSVYLYYAKLDSNGDVVYDSDGNPTAGEAVPSSAYSWSYSSESNLWNGVDGTVTNTITLTVPNGVPLVLIYNYAVTITGTSTEITAETTANAQNSAVLSADGNYISEITDYTTDSDTYSSSGTSLDLNGANSYIIHKVDAENFSIALEGAEFDLYVYDADKGRFVDVDTYTTDSNGQIKAAAVEKTDSETGETYYELTLSNGNTYDIPVDTLCYFVESSPSSSDYKLDTTKYYFYYGSGYTTAVSDCDGYALAYAAESGDLTAINLINFPSHTQYITNDHSPEYYSDKTTLSVLKFWLDSDGNEYEKTDGSISFYLYRLFTDTDGNVTYSPDNLSGSGDQGSDPNTGSGSSTGTSVKWGIYGAEAYNNYSTTALAEGTLTYTENSDGSVTIPFSFDFYPGTTFNQYNNANVVVSNGISSTGGLVSELTVTGSWTFASDETGGTYSGSVTIPAETEITYLAIYLSDRYNAASSYFSNVSVGSTGSSSGGDSGSGTTASSYKVNLSYGSYYSFEQNYMYELGSDSIEVSTDDGSTVNIKFSNSVSWNLSFTLVDWDASEVLLSDQSVEAGEDYTYTLTVGSSDRTLYLCCATNNISQYSVSLLSDYVYTADPDTGTEDDDDDDSGSTSSGDGDSGSTSSDDPDSGSTETETVIGDTYYHNFSLDSFTDDDTFTIGTDYKIASGSTTATETDFFDIYGNLSNSHGTCGYDLDGDGDYDADETLTICLKMQNNPQTTITFTPYNDGVLRLAFNASGNGTTDSVTNSCCIEGGKYTSKTALTATNNIIEVKLTGDRETTYTLTRSSTCYLFYMSFTEQDITVEETTDYLHSFNSGTTSNFYTISGSTGTASSSYGVVNYANEDIIQFLKMGSKAEITFDAPESGILYFVLTDAKDYYEKGKTVGVCIDGNEKEAEEYNDNYTTVGGVPTQDEVYLLTTRITAGTHTVTRINSTEYQLYYIGYVPDDYAHAAVYNDIPYSAYGELVYDDPITLSAANDWSWSSVALPSEYVTAEGEVKGYYTYYIVEVDETGKYITYYKNVTTTDSDGNTTLGIASGTMGIYNTLNDENEGVTHVTVNKQWLNQKDEDVTTSSSALAAITSDTSIWVDLFAKVYVYSENTSSYSSGKSYSRNFKNESTSDKLASDSDGFFTVSGAVNSSSNVGEVTYTDDDGTSTSYSKYLKFEGSTVVTFDSPATSGTLTLLASNWSSSDGYTTNGVNSIGFKLTAPDGKTLYNFTYSTSESNGLSGDYPDGSKATLYTADDGTGKVSVSGNGKAAANGVIVFDIATNAEGTWTLQRNSNSVQAYLFDISFAYTYNNLADGYGVYIGSYEITADDGWSKTISGLPLYIYADDESGSSSSSTPIGYYSYYVEEQDVSGDFENPTYTFTMDVGPIVTSIELIDEDSKKIKFAYHNKLTDTIGYATTTAKAFTYELDDNNKIVYITDEEVGSEEYGISYPSLSSATVVSSAITAVTKGSILVTNKAAEETFTLPSSGGSGTFKYIAAGMLTSLGAILLLYKRRKGLSAGS